MKCSCSSTSFKVEYTMIPEYNDAVVGYKVNLEGTKLKILEKKYQGSFYCDNCLVTCNACGKQYQVLDTSDDNIDHSVFDDSDEFNEFVVAISSI